MEYFYTCDITLDQFTVTKPLVSPEGGRPLVAPEKHKVGDKNENDPFKDNLILLPSVAINALTENEGKYNWYIVYSWGNIYLIA